MKVGPLLEALRHCDQDKVVLVRGEGEIVAIEHRSDAIVLRSIPPEIALVTDQ